MKEPRAGRSGADAEPPRTPRDVRRRTHGQNFLRSSRLVEALVEEAAVGPSDVVIEPGAGTGIITEQLARRARHVVAIEVDPDWFRKLQLRFANVPNVELRCQDFFEYRLPNDEKYRVFGNIPFRVTTKFLRSLLDDPRGAPTRCDVIVQLQVARKHASATASNALTATWQPWYKFSIARRIPAHSFRPVPRVDAGLLAIEKRSQPLLDPRERPLFAIFVFAGFSRRSVWDGLRQLLTSNQVRQLRRHSALAVDVAPSALTADAWVSLFTSAQRFRSP